MELILKDDLASRIIKYMQAKGYKIFENTKQYNIVYLEGAAVDGTPNDDRANQWNDRRLVLQILNGVPSIIGNWAATTEPGDYYTYNPMNAKGAARIAFGQYKSWVVGWHKNHEALVQTAPITVCRDLNEDFMRTGDRTDEGMFGVDQHWGGDSSVVGRWSAGCLVGQSIKGHKEFMALIKQDTRYQENKDYVYWTTVIPADDLHKAVS